MQEDKQYINGQKKYEMSGDIMTYYFKNGKIKATGQFVNDLMEGEWKFYRETGQLWQVGQFNNGKKNGVWIRYDKSNQLEYNEQFSDGKLIKK